MIESSGTSPKPDYRLHQALQWLQTIYGELPLDWQPVTGDASQRRYFRIPIQGQSYVLMDAPPEQGSSAPWVDVCARLQAAGLNAPRIIQQDLEIGMLLLEDLGDTLYRDILSPDNADALFAEAFAALATMATDVSTDGLPCYDEERLHQELDLFTHQYLQSERGLALGFQQRKAWMLFAEQLVNAMLEQPQGFVHRDVHSCNLLRTESNSPGIIDFQDAVKGPLTYDLVSLIWDRYQAWPRADLLRWMEQFRVLVAPDTPPEQWQRWCDFTGLQRNLRIVGRFTQLKLEEDKPDYMELLPVFYQYVLDVLAVYPEFSDMHDWLAGDACAP